MPISNQNPVDLQFRSPLSAFEPGGGLQKPLRGRGLPLLYLDFDGVLHHENVRWSPRHGAYLQAPAPHRLFQHVDLLEELLEPYPAVRIILSTSWVVRYGFRRAARRLPEALARRAIGATFHSQMDKTLFREAPRGMQVWSDVRRRQPSDWFALDDDYLHWPAWCKDKLIQTDEHAGISVPATQALIRERLRAITAHL